MLLLSEDQKLLMASARGAVAEKAPIAEFRKLRADPNGPGFSPAFWRACAELGWTGVLVPEAFGGLDFGVVGAGLIAREMARDLAPLALPVDVGSVGERARPRGFAGAEGGVAATDRARRSDRLVRARRRRRAPARSRPRRRARAGAGGSTAPSSLVLDGHAADAILIAAEADGETALFLAKADAPGLSRDARTLVDARRVASVALDGVSVDAERAS